MYTSHYVKASKHQREDNSYQKDTESRTSSDELQRARAIAFPDDMKQSTTSEHPPRIPVLLLEVTPFLDLLTYLKRGSYGRTLV